ncbi:MAG: aldehyde dehydrogenase family protein [Chloroflexota bacterium]
MCQGFFFQPSLIGGVAQDSEIVQKEIFGPVLERRARLRGAPLSLRADGIPPDPRCSDHESPSGWSARGRVSGAGPPWAAAPVATINTDQA